MTNETHRQRRAHAVKLLHITRQNIAFLDGIECLDLAIQRTLLTENALLYSSLELLDGLKWQFSTLQHDTHRTTHLAKLLRLRDEHLVLGLEETVLALNRDVFLGEILDDVPARESQLTSAGW